MEATRPQRHIFRAPALTLGLLLATGCGSPRTADQPINPEPAPASAAAEASVDLDAGQPVEASTRVSARVSAPAEPTPLPDQELTDAEARRNERFGDRRRKRYTPN